MRTIATSLLVVMTLIFIATRFAPPGWVWAPYLGAFAEAGMIGACADWFAVVALFRHPLGLPIPHTAIVPENKRRIGAALGRFVTNNFLSPRVAAERLRAIDLVGLAARGLADPRNAERSRPSLRGLRRMRSRPCPQMRSKTGSAASPDAAPRRCRSRRSPRARLPSFGRKGPGRRCSIRASTSSRPRSPPTRRPSSNRCGASRAHGSRNGSTRLSPTEFCRDWPERWKTCVGPTIPGAPRSRGG